MSKYKVHFKSAEAEAFIIVEGLDFDHCFGKAINKLNAREVENMFDSKTDICMSMEEIHEEDRDN